MGKRKCCHSEYFLFICMHAKLLNDFTGKICHVFQCKKDMQRWKLASTNVTGKGTFCSLSGFVTSFFSKWKIVFYCCIFLLSPFLSFIIIFLIYVLLADQVMFTGTIPKMFAEAQ